MSIVPDSRLASSAAVFSIARTVMRRNGAGGPHPMWVRLEHDVRPGRNLADAIGAVVEARVGRVGGIPGLHPILLRIGEGSALDMRRQHDEIVDRGIVEGQLADMHREGLGVLRVDAGNAAIQLRVADGALPVAPDLVGEQHVFGRDRDAVAPGRIGLDRIGQIDPLAAVGQIDRSGPAVLDRGKLGAQQADELPVRVVDRERPHPPFRARNFSPPLRRCSGSASRETA